MKHMCKLGAALVAALFASQDAIALFSISSKKQQTTINCYKNINMPVSAESGAQVQIVLGDCISDITNKMGKAGDIVRKTPNSIVNLGNLPASKSGIAFPAQGRSLALQFVPTSGPLARAKISFLIENVASEKISQELELRNLTNLDIVKEARAANKPLAVLVYYRQLGGQLEWVDLGQTILLAEELPTTFSAKVDASGKLQTSSSGNFEQDGMLYDLSQFNFVAQ